MKLRAIYGTSQTYVDLAVPVDPERDHIRGPADAAVTLVEYGDFECPYCGQAEPVIRELLADLSRVSGTPTSFINGHRHHRAYNIATLSAEVRAARARVPAAPGL
jgi:protein-disulfide isomerase